MAGGGAEKLNSKENNPEAKKAHASCKVRNGNLKAKTPMKGKPHNSQYPSLVRRISKYYQSAIYSPKKTVYKKYSSA